MAFLLSAWNDSLMTRLNRTVNDKRGDKYVSSENKTKMYGIWDYLAVYENILSQVFIYIRPDIFARYRAHSIWFNPQMSLFIKPCDVVN